MGMLFLPFIMVIFIAIIAGFFLLLISFVSMFSKSEDSSKNSSKYLKSSGIAFLIAVISYFLLENFINSIY